MKQQQEQQTGGMDDFEFDDTLQAAFKQWIRLNHTDSTQFTEHYYSCSHQRAM